MDFYKNNVGKNGEILDGKSHFPIQKLSKQNGERDFFEATYKTDKKYKIKRIHCAVFINVNKLIHIIGRFCGEIASHTASNVLSVGMQKVLFIAER